MGVCEPSCSNPCEGDFLKHVESCTTIGWWSSWWFWQWGSSTYEDWCEPIGSLPSDAVSVAKTLTVTSTIPTSCLFGGCEGVVQPISCPSGFDTVSSEDVCAKEAGLATVDRKCEVLADEGEESWRWRARATRDVRLMRALARGRTLD